MLHQYDDLCILPSGTPDIQTAWEFTHPLPPSILQQSALRRGGSVQAGGSGMVGGDGWNEHNARFCHLRFTASNRGVCHGLGGYFETVLYTPEDKSKKAIELSINPNTMEEKSKDMISWFPMFFPLKVCLSLPFLCVRAFLLILRNRHLWSSLRLLRLKFPCGVRLMTEKCGMNGKSKYSLPSMECVNALLPASCNRPSRMGV
jgi:hypothetical protein